MRRNVVGTDRARTSPGRDRLAVAALVLLALALRVFVVWRANEHAPNSAARLFGDEPEYNNLALGLLHGHWFDWPARLPLYPAFVTAIHGLSGESYDALLYVQAVVGALTVIPAWWLGRELMGRAVGLLAAFGVAVHWSLVMQSTRELSEVLYTPALLIAMLALARAFKAPTLRRFALAGALLGIATLTRPTALLFPIALAPALAILWRSWSRALRFTAVFSVALGLVIVSWTINNALRYRTFLPLSTSVAVLWQGSPEYYELSQHGRTYLSIWQHELNPAENGGHYVGSIEGDRYFTRRALDSIRDHPGIYAWYSLQKVAWYWIGHPSADWFGGSVLSPYALTPYWPWWEMLMIMFARLLPLAALAAIWLLRLRWRELLPVYALLAFFTLAHALSWAELRLSEPLAPYLAILVAGAAVRVWQLSYQRTEVGDRGFEPPTSALSG